MQIRIRSKSAIGITLSGWLLLAAFGYYEYLEYGRGGLFTHLVHPSFRSSIFLHVAMVFAPVISTAFGYLVEERSKVLMKLRGTEALYRDFYQNAPDGYHSLGPRGEILDVNDTWLRMTGWERSEVLGREISELLSSGDLAVFERKFSALMAKGLADNAEYEFRKKDGGLLPVVVNATASYDKQGRFLKSRATVRDNTIKKSYETMLTQASEEWRKTFDSMPYGVMLLDREGDIIRANKYMARLAGMPVRELPGKKCHEILHQSDKPIALCPLVMAEKSKKEETAEYHESRIGRHYMLSATPIFDTDGSVSVYVHTVIDITAMKENEKKLGQSKAAFSNMLQDVNAAYKELRGLYENLVVAFANAIDAKSPWTKGHSERVTRYAMAIAREMALQEKEMQILRIASLLHDVGKIGTYDEILNKPGKLTDEEFTLVKMHPARGEAILKPIQGLDSELPIIRAHHERVDGRGYPDGLKDEQIPRLAKILCVADSFDSMTADRPYRASPGLEFAVVEMKKCSNTQFAPEVVEAFLRVIDREPSLLVSIHQDALPVVQR